MDSQGASSSEKADRQAVTGPNRLSSVPAIILVEPQLGENVGACARAMLNCGLRDLRLVRPRDGWPNERARAAATAAVDVVDGARLFDTTGEAIADLTAVYATTARRRHMLKDQIELEPAVQEMLRLQPDAQAGFLFGPERTGLDNDDVALATKVLHIPLDPGFQSLNLAQAVLLVSYEVLRQHRGGEVPHEPEDRSFSVRRARAPASSEELQGFFQHLEGELDEAGFFRVAEKRPAMVRTLRNLFHRADLRSHEVRSLRGVISALVLPREMRGRRTEEE